MDLSAESLQAIGLLIDQRLAAALSIAIADVEERIEARIQSRLDERLAAIESKHCNTIRELEERVAAFAENNTKLKRDIFQLEDDTFELHDRLEDQEQRGRRYNVRIENIGFDVSPREETEEMLFSKIQSELKKIDIEISPSEVVRIHRSSRPRPNEIGVLEAQSIIKVATWSARKKLNNVNRLARAKKLSIRAHHDLTRERLDLLQYARARIDRAMSRKFSKEQMKTLGDNEKCFAYATLNCDIIMRLNGTTFPFKSTEEFDDLFWDKFSFA